LRRSGDQSALVERLGDVEPGHLGEALRVVVPVETTGLTASAAPSTGKGVRAPIRSAAGVEYGPSSTAISTGGSKLVSART
jgi:hypothetical protein